MSASSQENGTRIGRQLMRTAPAAVVLLAALGGCAAGTVARAPLRPYVGARGTSWAVVFPGPAVRAADQAGARPELARRDALYNPRPARADVALNIWPDPARPDLNRPRRLLLPTRASHVIWFRPTPAP